MRAEPCPTTFSNDQSSQVTIADSIGRFDCVVLPGQLVDQARSRLPPAADGSTFSTLDKIVSGVGSQILDLSSVAWSAGDVLKLAVSGRTLTAYKNGIAIGTITDPDVASGQPGACIFESSADGNGTSFDDWVGETNATSATSSAAPTTTSSAQSSGQALTVTQAGVSCAYALSAASQAFTAAGGTGSVNVSGQGGCGWTASSSAPAEQPEVRAELPREPWRSARRPTPAPLRGTRRSRLQARPSLSPRRLRAARLRCPQRVNLSPRRAARDRLPSRLLLAVPGRPAAARPGCRSDRARAAPARAR